MPEIQEIEEPQVELDATEEPATDEATETREPSTRVMCCDEAA
jgi:hypothetical protein